jgi:hypothetical protein
MDTENMLKLASALFKLLPASVRIIPFITSPLSRGFRREGGEKRFLLKLVNERPAVTTEKEQYVDIGQAYDSSKTPELQSGAAHYFIDEFNRGGYEAVKNLHQMWEKKYDAVESTAISPQDNFVTRLRVNREGVNLDAIREMIKKGKKDEARLFIRVILDERKLKSARELADISTILLEISTPKDLDTDIMRLFNSVKDMEPAERLSVFESLINSNPKKSNEIFNKLKAHFGDSLLHGIKDISVYPAISSQIFKVDNYENLEKVNLILLKGTAIDAALFEKNLKFTLEKVRSLFPERSLDFILNLISNFAEHKKTIINHMKIDDIFPGPVRNRLSGSMRPFFLSQIDKVLRILKENPGS